MEVRANRDAQLRFGRRKPRRRGKAASSACNALLVARRRQRACTCPQGCHAACTAPSAPPQQQLALGCMASRASTASKVWHPSVTHLRSIRGQPGPAAASVRAWAAGPGPLAGTPSGLQGVPVRHAAFTMLLSLRSCGRGALASLLLGVWRLVSVSSRHSKPCRHKTLQASKGQKCSCASSWHQQWLAAAVSHTTHCSPCSDVAARASGHCALLKRLNCNH